jgi:putative ABC transport system permease protein
MAAVTIATGIGAVVAMFSVYHAAILNPVRVPEPNRLVAVAALSAKIPNVPAALSWIRFDNSLRHARSFSAVAAYDFDSASVTAAGQPPEQLRALRVSSDFFRVLGVSMQSGRAFSASDDQVNGPAVCILTHELWQTRFGGQHVVGRTIDLNGRPVEVIGITPPRFTPPWSDQQVFLPRLFETSTLLPENVQNGASFLSVIARLAPGVTVEQAQAELDGLAAEYASAFAGRMDAANSTAVGRLVDGVVGGQRQTFAILLAAVAAVLLVACANASTLFLGQLLARQREIAVRQALGASRPRIVRQFLLESLGLSCVAGVVGVAVSWVLLRAVTVLLGTSLPQGIEFAIDGPALAVALVIVVVTSLLVGLVPSLYVTGPTMAPLQAFARGTSTTASGRRLRALLVLGEVALSCVLLIGAALLVVSLLRLQQSHPGFDVAATAAGLITLPQAQYTTPERQAAFATDVIDRLQRSAGVQKAAAVFGVPLGDEFSFHQFVVAGRPIPAPSQRPRAGIRLITEDYFEVMRIRLKAGRAFTARDRQGAPPVCIINESLARRMFEGDPLGQSILRGRDANLRYEIVGIVEDVHTYGPRRAAVDEVFYPLRQLPWPQLAIVARTDSDPALLRRTMEQAVAAVDPTVPLARFATLAHRLDLTWGSEKTMASLTIAFAAIALLMALVGLYAVLAQTVASRTAEIGVRVALGAGRPTIVRLILGNGMRLVVAGIGVGLGVAAAAAQALESQLYSVNPRDPWVFGGVAGLFATVALLACVVPSWRAARLDPIKALHRA